MQMEEEIKFEEEEEGNEGKKSLEEATRSPKYTGNKNFNQSLD